MKIFIVILVCIGLFTASIFFSRPDLLRSLFNAVFKRPGSKKADEEVSSSEGLHQKNAA